MSADYITADHVDAAPPGPNYVEAARVAAAVLWLAHGHGIAPPNDLLEPGRSAILRQFQIAALTWTDLDMGDFQDFRAEVRSELGRYTLAQYWHTFALRAREAGDLDDARLYEEAAIVVWRRSATVSAWPWPCFTGSGVPIFRGLSSGAECTVCDGAGWLPGSEHMGHVERLGCYACHGGPFTPIGAERRRLATSEGRPSSRSWT